MKHITSLLLFHLLMTGAFAQQTNIDSSKFPRAVNFSNEQDHAYMLKQLGITKLRPGPSADQSKPNHSNENEQLANPCPELPDVLTSINGKKIKTADEWWKTRRPELLEQFEKEIYGRIPAV